MVLVYLFEILPNTNTKLNTGGESHFIEQTRRHNESPDAAISGLFGEALAVSRQAPGRCPPLLLAGEGCSQLPGRTHPHPLSGDTGLSRP